MNTKAQAMVVSFFFFFFTRQKVQHSFTVLDVERIWKAKGNVRQKQSPNREYTRYFKHYISDGLLISFLATQRIPPFTLLMLSLSIN